MGKGDEDLRVIIDTDGGGNKYYVELHLYDEMTAAEYSSLKAEAAVSQAAFDIEAADTWGWYSTRLTSTEKARLRSSFLAV